MGKRLTRQQNMHRGRVFTLVIREAKYGLKMKGL